MPNLAAFHPQIVHFVVALLFIGVALRVLSIVWRQSFINLAAALCLIGGTIAAALAVKSGVDAHGPVERIPGVRAKVVEHEEYGERTRNIFFVVAVLEIVGLAVSSRAERARFARWIHVASAVVGVYGATPLYEAAEEGGELVYSYGGGPGLRTGESQDVQRLLIAGLYNQAREERKAGRPAEAARLIGELARLSPTDPEAQLLRVESLIIDRGDYAAALTAADSITIAPTDTRLLARQANLKADAYLKMSKPDSARAVLQAAVSAIPQNARLKARLDSLK